MCLRKPVIARREGSSGFAGASSREAIAIMKKERVVMATQYEALIKAMVEAAAQHPKSFVVIDANTSRTIATGKDMDTAAAKALANLKAGDVPLIFQQQQKDQILILGQS
jgi:hypothetical protein